MAVKSYSQRKRESYDYRANYLEHNPGYFKGLYICSQCGKILTKNTMEVDHIFPVSKWWAPNRVINCVAICSECNKRKSDKVTWKMSIKAILCKILEESYLLLSFILLMLRRLIFILLVMLIRMMLTPLKTDRSIVQKCVIVCAYCYTLAMVLGIVA